MAMSRTNGRRPGIVSWIGASVILALCAASAQDVPQQPRLQYEVSVTLRLIQVYVTDKSGQPVRDLTKDDFVVFDGKKPVIVTDFEKHDLGLVPAAAAPEAAVPETRPAPAHDINRKFIIFFDFAFNNAWGVTAGVKAALDFLDTAVKPGDEAALLSYSMTKGLKVHEFLTADIAKVRKAVSVVTAKEIAGRADEIEHEYWQSINALGGLASGDGPGAGAAKAEISRMDAERRDSSHQAQSYLLGLTSFARAMRLVQGRKIVLFFSTGVPSSLIYQNRTMGGNIDSGRSLVPGVGGTSVGGSEFAVGNSVLPDLQETMLKEFSASDCSFYAFDTRPSAKNADLFGYDRRSFDVGISPIFSVVDPTGNMGNIFRNDKTTGMDTLKRLSKQTGGLYYSNIALHEKNMEQVRDIAGTYYVLGYSAATVSDGAFRDVKVEVKRKGLKVRTQAGYFNPKSFGEYTDLEKRLNLLDLALNEHSSLQAPAPISIAALSYDAGGGTRLRAVARVPKDLLTGFQGKTVEFVAVFFNEQGNLLSLQRTVLDPASYAGNDVVLTAGVAARPGRAKCRIILRDLETGKSALGSADAYIVAPAMGGLRLYSPLLLVRRPGAALIDGVVQGTPESPAWREVYAYDPSLFMPLAGGDPLTGEGFVVAVPFSAPGSAKADLVFKVNLVNSETGGNVTVPFTPMTRSRAGGVEVQHLEIPAGSVPAGKYLLYIHVADKSSGAAASAHVPLTILR